MKTKISLKKRRTLLRLHHEIRTPLNIFLGFMQILMLDTNLTSMEKQKYFIIINEVCDDFFNNLDEILEMKLSE